MRLTPAHQLLLVFLIAAGVRCGWVIGRYAGDPDRLAYPDEEAYVLSASSLARGEGLIDEFGYRATYMPGYPAFLAAFQWTDVSLLWPRLAQALAGGWTAVAAALLAGAFARATGQAHERGIALLAGLAVACDPFLIMFSGLLLTEALFAAGLVSLWLLVIRAAGPRPLSWRGVVGMALLIWACIMLRPASCILLALVPAALLLSGLSRRRLAGSMAIPVLVLLGLLPWAVRNQRLIGEWEFLTTRGGISLYDGFRPDADGGSDLGPAKQIEELAGLPEARWNAWFRDRAVEQIRAEPRRAIRLAGEKFARTWNIVLNQQDAPGGRWASLASAAWMVPALITAAIGLWRCRRRLGPLLALLLPVVGFTALHMIYVGSVRYRVPIMPMVLVLSATGLCGLLYQVEQPAAAQVPEQVRP